MPKIAANQVSFTPRPAIAAELDKIAAGFGVSKSSLMHKCAVYLVSAVEAGDCGDIESIIDDFLAQIRAEGDCIEAN